MTDENLMNALIRRPFAAYHEAGHVVVALSLGMQVDAVWITDSGTGCTEFAVPQRLQPDRLKTITEEREMCRRLIVIDVAGHVANYLHDQWGYFWEWPTRAHLRKAREEWDFSSDLLISNRYASERSSDTVEDLEQVRIRVQLLMAHKAIPFEPGQKRGYSASIVPMDVCLRAIRRAERQAETILKQHWDAVETVANALLRSKALRVNKGRLTKLVGNHFKK